MSQVPLPFSGEPKKALEPRVSQVYCGGFLCRPCSHSCLSENWKKLQYAHAIEMLKKLILKREKSSLKHKINHWEPIPPIPLCKQGAANECPYP